MKKRVLLAIVCLTLSLFAQFKLAVAEESVGSATVTELGGVGSTAARITLLLPKLDVFYVDVYQFLTQKTTVVVNVTVDNYSPYSAGTLFYRVTNLDSNETVWDWSEGESRVLTMGSETNLTITTSVPVGNMFTPDSYKLEAKLVLPQDSLTGETTFTVEKTLLKQSLQSLAVVALCLVLVGVAYYSYKNKRMPWDKYPQPKTT